MSITYTQKPKGIIFDCDGVIIDSFDTNTVFYNALRKAVGLPDMTEAQRLEAHQMTGAQAFDLIIPPALRQAGQKAAREINYERDIAPNIPINEGLHSLLEYCKSQNIPTGIHTNRIIAMKEILELNNLSQFFTIVMTPAVLPAKPDPIGSLTICEKWNIKPEEALFIGDSNNDLNTAKAANIPLIGFKNPELITENKAESFLEVENWLRSI